MRKIKDWLRRTNLVNDKGQWNGGLIISVAMLSIVLVQQVFAVFNITVPVHQDQIMGLINTVLTIGGLLGLVYDFNNKGGDNSGH